MRSIYSSLLTLALTGLLNNACGAAPPAAALLPASFTAHYSFSKDGIQLGETIRTLQPLAHNHYLFKSVSKATGLLAWFIKDRLEEQSQWIYDGSHRPRPLQYEYRRQGGRKERHVQISFNWKKSMAINNINGDAWRMVIPGGTMDKLLFQLALMIDLQHPPDVIEYPVADGGRLKRYRLKVHDRKILNTRMGLLQTIKVERLGDKRRTTVWCAPALRYLPVRIEQVENGSRLHLILQSVKGLDH